MAKKNQSERLTNQHKESQGVVGIFGAEAKLQYIRKVMGKNGIQKKCLIL